MVMIETARRRQPLCRLQLSTREAIFTTGARLQRQPRVSPQLPFRSEPMWCLKQGDQECDSDRAQQRNLSEKLLGGMLLALRQQLPTCLTTYLHQPVELLIKLLSTSTHAGFR